MIRNKISSTNKINSSIFTLIEFYPVVLHPHTIWKGKENLNPSEQSKVNKYKKTMPRLAYLYILYPMNVLNKILHFRQKFVIDVNSRDV